MVENNLEFDELRRLLRPVLRLKSMQTILGELGSAFGIQLQDEREATAQTKLRLRYKGFELRIGRLQWFDGAGATLQMTFLTARKWWHLGPLDQRRVVIADLKAICQEELDGLRFFEDRTVGHHWVEPGKTFEIRLIHDARAYRFSWKEQSDSSPLWISPWAGEGCGVAFFFNAGGYQRSGEKITLRADWEVHSCDLSTFLHEYGRENVHKAVEMVERIEHFRDGRHLDDLP